MLIASAKTVSEPKLDQTGGSTDLSGDKTHAMQEIPIPYLDHIESVISSLILNFFVTIDSHSVQQKGELVK